MLSSERTPSLLVGLASCAYIFVSSGIIKNELTGYQTLGFVLFAITVSAFSALILGPAANHLITLSVSKRMAHENAKPGSPEERTKLIQDTMQLPTRMSLQLSGAIGFAMISCVLFLSIACKIRAGSIVYISIGCFFCIYNTALLAENIAEDVCSGYVSKLAVRSLDVQFIRKKKFFGMDLHKKIRYWTIIPAILSVTMVFSYFYFAQGTTAGLCGILLINTFVLISNSCFLYKRTIAAFSKINANLNSFAEGQLDNEVELTLDFSNQISYNIFLISEIIRYVREITIDSSMTGVNILNSIFELTDNSKSIAQLSESHSASIKECLAKMEKATELLDKITDRIADVRFTAENTKNTVNESSALLDANIAKASQITAANLNTITGIKNLSEQIEKVWDIINTIDSIADKTQIIAFNAELEASYAGEQGEKFHIIANEIRRLASTISDSIQEIKEQVTQIQHSSDNLIITSEASTQKIHEEKEFLSNMDEQFSSLRLSSDITAESATQIQDNTNNQDSSFIQIDFTLREISLGFDKFSASAKQLNETAEKIRTIALDLNSIHTKENQA